MGRLVRQRLISMVTANSTWSRVRVRCRVPGMSACSSEAYQARHGTSYYRPSQSPYLRVLIR